MSDYWKDNGITKPQSIIVCAANKFPDDGTVLLGARHWDKHMRAQAENTYLPIGTEKQGFIDQFGDFYDRKEALKIVLQNRQPFNEANNGSKDELYSEGLY